MSAGVGALLQLYAIGQQDKHLTIEPQVDFFKAVYHRHVHLALETIQDEFPQSLQFGSRSVIKVPLDADYLGECYLELILPNLGNPGQSWCSKIGYALVKRLRLFIDDALVHELDKYTMDVLDELGAVHGRSYARGRMIGTEPLPTDREHVLYIPLNFFHGRPAKGHGWLPLRALRNSLVRIEIEVEAMENVLVPRPQARNTARIEHKVLYQCAFVARETLPFHMDQEVLIEQVQKTDAVNYETGNDLELFIKTYVSMALPFLNYVKQIVWTVQRQEDIEANNHFDYLDVIDTGSFFFDGIEHQAPRPGGYYRLVQHYEYGARCPVGNIHAFSFALEPDIHQPSGFAFLSAFSDKRARFEFVPEVANQRLLVQAYALTYNILNSTGGKGALRYV